jgi:DNA (cytosine-5)-methyltransferase 1
MTKLRVFEAFSGYGSQSLALEYLGIPHEVVAISEVDKYAIQGYEALHGKANNLGDISKINVEDIPEHDLFTYSFPCQDISIAGRGLSLEEGSGTRSSLLWECKKVIEHCKPKYLLLENVKNYGVPQNRERVFVVSILGEHKPFEFGEEIPLTKCISDILDDEVDEKFYMNKPFHLVNKGHQAELDMKGYDGIKRAYSTDNIAPTLNANNGGNTEPKILVVANTNSSFESEKRVYGTNGIAPTLTARDYKGAKQILIPQATKKGYIEMNVPGVCDLLYPNSKTRRGRVQEGGAIAPALMTSQMLCYIDEEKATDKGHVVCEQRCDEGLRFFKDNVCGTIRTVNSGGDKRIIDVNNYRIRKLTPSECLRLMGLHESEIEKLKASGLSNTRLYKLAGNSIVVNVLESIFSQLFKE